MVEVWLPYGKTEVHISVPLRYLLGTVEPAKGEPAENPFDTVIQSLKSPIEKESLGDLVNPRVKVAVALEGTMAPATAVNAASAVVWTLNQAGVLSENITLVIGNGLREGSSPQLREGLSGSQLLQTVQIVEHNRNTGTTTSIGATSARTVLEVCSPFVEADFRIAIGEIMLDHFSGMRGAQSTVLPALARREAVEQNRGLAFRGGVTPGEWEDNPVYADQIEAARMARVDFAVHLLTNGYGELLSAFSGDVEASWSIALPALGDSYKVKAEPNADIIVVSAG
ncbi:MAG: DUF2088 domain-containing protein, partial [Candidatus Bathyarchaeota archaeon]